MTKCPNCGRHLITPKTPFEEDCIIGDFLIKSKVGAGSIGTVYKAVQLSLERTVALKILSPEYTNAKGIEDFLKEARAAAQLNHPNIVQVMAVGEESGVCYMAMNYILGETLKNRIKGEGRIQVDEALHIVQQVAEALYYAWDEARIIHRDVKPDNIMITEDGVVKLTDLGLAMHQTDWEEDMEISGSPSYMSPEQFLGEKLDTRSDIYSLGVTLYQMLSGELPFEGETLRTVATQHFDQPPPSLSKLDSSIPSDVSAMVRKMLAKLPEDRYASMEELLSAIWTIRQKTAPNTDMIPDVHTISINRLNYSWQKERDLVEKMIKAKAEASLTEKVQKKNTNHKTLFVILLIIFIVLGIWAVLSVKTKYDAAKIRSLVTNYETQVANNVFSLAVLKEKGHALLHKIQDDPPVEIENFRLKTLLIIRGLENLLLLDEYEKLKEENEQLGNEVVATRNEYEAFLSTRELERQMENKNMRRLDNMNDSVKKIRNENAALKKNLEKIQTEMTAVKGKWQDAWQYDINIKLYSLIHKNCFLPAKTLLEYQAQLRGPEYREWFSKKQKLLESLNNSYGYLTESGSQLSGQEIQGLGSIVIISDGEIHYKEPNGIIRRLQWNEIPLDSACGIVEKLSGVPTEDFQKRNNIKAEILILEGEIIEASKIVPVDADISGLINSVLNQTVDKIRYFAAVDIRKTELKAESFLEQLQGSPAREHIEKEIKNILSRYSEEENLPPTALPLWKGQY